MDRNATKTAKSESLDAKDNAVKKALYPGKKCDIKSSLKGNATSRIPGSTNSCHQIT